MMADDEPFSTTAATAGQNALWNGLPPPPPDARTVAKDLSCQGIIASTLQQALDEIQSLQQNEKEQQQQIQAEAKEGTEDDPEESEQVSQPLIRMDDTTVNSIMQAFGESYAESQQQQGQDDGNDDDHAAAAPAALLQGRLQHYNRRNTKWRIVIQDAEFRRRAPLQRNRRKRERPSLWQISEEQNSNTSAAAAAATSKCTVEIRAYNDLE